MTVSFTVTNNLPFVSVTIHANDKSLVLNRVLLDTGSAATTFKFEDLAKLEVFQQPLDKTRVTAGIGGLEY